MVYCSTRTIGPLFYTTRKLLLQSFQKYNTILKEFLYEEQISSQLCTSDVVCEEQSSLQTA